MSVEWTEREAVHLLSRAAFFPSKEDVSASVELGMTETVRRLVTGESLTDKVEEILPFEEVKADGKNLVADQIVDQQTYWLYRMIKTEAPLIEKITLFWHGHFATSYQKVREIHLITRQNELFREYALGSFHDLVLEIGRDPAMMLWLDSNRNKKGKPNENYAREVMELFTLGIGNYTETDIRELARSLTGWNYDKVLDEVKFNKNQFDAGAKTVLGETGKFDDRTAIEVLFHQDALPAFMADKLLQYFGSEHPSAEWVGTVAADFKSSTRISDVLYNLFTSDEFYKEEYRGAMIKTPVEYVVGILKAFNLPMARGFAQASRKMGQELYLPPDVAGWRGGATWFMSTSLLSRYQFAESVAKRINNAILTSSAFKLNSKATAEEFVSAYSANVGLWNLGENTSQTLASYANDTFIHSTSKQSGMKGLLQLMMISPEAQMK
jgi:uncharacterized protein (DUF1800 family)